MSKRLRYLLVIGVFIISMAIVLTVLLLTQPKDEEESSDSSTSATISVLSYDRDNIATMTIKNENGEFTIRNGVSGFVIDEYSAFRQNSTTMGAAGRCVTSLNAQALVEENAQDLSKYGLSDDSPKSSVTVTLKDGTSYTVYFGDDAPDGDTRYFRLSDSNTVYTVGLNSSGYFYYKADDFLSLIVTDELTNNNTAPTLDHLVIKRKDLDYDVEFVDDSKNYDADEIAAASAQVMISPVYAYLDITNSTAIMYGLWGLTASDIVKVYPTEEDFETYGLNDPFCEVILDAELQRYHLRIGNVASYTLDQNGEETTDPYEYYCYYDGIDIIYTFTLSEIPFANFMPIDILSPMMTSNYVLALDYIDIEYFGDDPASYYFELESDIEAAEMLSGTLNGEDFDTEEFKYLYQFILKCPIDDLYFDEPGENNPLVAKIHFMRDDGAEDILEFYDIGSNRVCVKLNGHPSFSQPIGYLKVLRQNLDVFADGGTRDDLQEIW